MLLQRTHRLDIGLVVTNQYPGNLEIVQCICITSIVVLLEFVYMAGGAELLSCWYCLLAQSCLPLPAPVDNRVDGSD